MTSSATTSPPPPVRPAVTAMTARLARADPTFFPRLLLAAPLPAVHRALQAFLTARRHALVELPRDHGKTTQVCLRVLWELGRRPGLRVKLVCSTDAIAADR